MKTFYDSTALINEKSFTHKNNSLITGSQCEIHLARWRLSPPPIAKFFKKKNAITLTTYSKRISPVNGDRLFITTTKKKNSKKFSIIISRNHGNHNNIFSSATANKLAEGRKMFGRVERFPSTNGAFLTSEKFPASDKERHVTAKSNCASDRFIRQNSIVSFKGSGKRPHVTISPRDWRFERSRDFSL